MHTHTHITLQGPCVCAWERGCECLRPWSAAVPGWGSPSSSCKGAPENHLAGHGCTGETWRDGRQVRGKGQVRGMGKQNWEGLHLRVAATNGSWAPCHAIHWSCSSLCTPVTFLMWCWVSWFTCSSLLLVTPVIYSHYILTQVVSLYWHVVSRIIEINLLIGFHGS